MQTKTMIGDPEVRRQMIAIVSDAMSVCAEYLHAQRTHWLGQGYTRGELVACMFPNALPLLAPLSKLALEMPAAADLVANALPSDPRNGLRVLVPGGTPGSFGCVTIEWPELRGRA